MPSCARTTKHPVRHQMSFQKSLYDYTMAMKKRRDTTFSSTRATQNARPSLECPVLLWSLLSATPRVYRSVGYARIVVLEGSRNGFKKRISQIVVSLYGSGRVSAPPNEESLCHFVCRPRCCQMVTIWFCAGGDSPANRSAWHGGDNTGLQTTEVSSIALPLMDYLGRLEEAGDVLQLCVSGISACL